jgi:hypothetical protein
MSGWMDGWMDGWMGGGGRSSVGRGALEGVCLI